MTKICAEYIFLDIDGNIRSKTRIFDSKNDISYPVWTYDGSSTGQSHTKTSDLILVPQQVYNDPFRGKPNTLVLCESYLSDGNPIESNTRANLVELCALPSVLKYDLWFGIEQEYVIMERDNKSNKINDYHPYKWLSPNNPGFGDQGPYYCGVGGNVAFGRDIVEEHLKLCIEANLPIRGINAEVMPSQWEFQLGSTSSDGIDALTLSDSLIIARYILQRLSEKYNCFICYDPKPLSDWNGSGAHINISTNLTRGNNGIEEIYKCINKMEKTHKEHIDIYGKNNDKRLTGKYETSSIDKFTFGNTDRGSSIRIPINVVKAGKGYFEDRRPAANVDPYLAMTHIIKTLTN